jgi:DNA-binding CsgD family transcriptional regulator
MPVNVLIWDEIDLTRVQEQLKDLVKNIHKEIWADKLIAQFPASDWRNIPKLRGILAQRADHWISRAYAIYLEIWGRPESQDFKATVWEFGIEQFIKGEIVELLRVSFDISDWETPGERHGAVRMVREGLEQRWRQQLTNPEALQAAAAILGQHELRRQQMINSPRYQAAVRAMCEYEQQAGNPAFQVPPIRQLAGKEPVAPAGPLAKEIAPQTMIGSEPVEGQIPDALKQAQAPTDSTHQLASAQPSFSASGGPDRKPKLPPKKQDLSVYFDRAPLTERQRECLSLRLEYGLTVSQIAERLGITRKVVDEHIEAATRKLDNARVNDKVRARKAVHDPEQ